VWPCKHAIEVMCVEDDLVSQRRTVVSLEQVARRAALALLSKEEKRARSFTQSMWPSKLACNEGGFLLLLWFNDQCLTVESLDAVYMELPYFLSNSKALIPL